MRRIRYNCALQEISNEAHNGDSDNMGQIVFSDVAGTIIEGNPWDYVRQHPGYNRPRGERELWKFLPVVIGRRLNLVTDTTFRIRWLKGMAAIFDGMEREAIIALFDDVVNQRMAHLYRDDVIARLKAHQQQGDTVIMVSGMFVEMVQLFADRIGADGALGTHMAYDGDIALGEIAGQPCVGPGKLDFIEAYLRDHHPGVAISDCYGYADSYSDRAMLGAVGHGVATYPEPDLLEFAQTQNWEIIPAQSSASTHHPR